MSRDRAVQIHSTHGASSRANTQPQTIPAVADLAHHFDLPCAGKCSALDELLGGYTLASSADIISQRLAKHDGCPGPTKKFLGGVGCGSK